MSNLPAVVDRSASNVPAEYSPIPLRSAGSKLPTDGEFQMMASIANSAIEAGVGMVPKNITNPKQALAVMLAGYEIGFTPFAALRQIFPVNGKMELMTQGLISLVMGRDPTAFFLFHEYSHAGADVELFRGGRSMIRVSYTDADADRSKQGYTKKGEWQQTSGGKNYFKPETDRDGHIVYEIDQESPWWKYRRDMHAYNAVKRCVRLAASDCINLAITVRSTPELEAVAPRILLERGPEPEAPLHKALVSGEITPAAVFHDEAPDDIDAPHEGDTPPDAVPPTEAEHGEQQETDPQATPGQRDATPSPASPPEENPPGVEDVPMATRGQLASITEWQQLMQEKFGAKALADLVAWTKFRFPYAVEKDKLLCSRLTLKDAALYIANVRHAVIEKQGRMPQADDEWWPHELGYNNEAEPVCRLCNLPLFEETGEPDLDRLRTPVDTEEAPPTEHGEQPSLGAQT